MAPRRTSLRAGFSLLELVIALTLVSIVASLAIPFYFERSVITLENAAVQLCRDLRAAQNRAAYLGITATVEFREDGTGYEVLGEGRTPLPGPHGSPEFVREYTRDGVFEGVRILDLELNSDQRRIRYGPQGTAVEGGTITIEFQGDTRTVSVRRGNGLLAILDSSSGWLDDGL